MKIIKIGGTALSNLSNIIDFADTVKHSNRPILLVISAFDKLSSDLKKLHFDANFDKKSSPFSFFREFSSILSPQECVYFFTYLDKVEIILTKRLKGIAISGETPLKVMDEILSFGELISSFFVHCYFNSRSIANQFLDIRSVIETDENFGKAKPNIEVSLQRIKAIKLDTGLIVTQGFIAADKKGNSTTMGFESSNLSATILAKGLSSNEIDIYTKVNRIYTADPEKFPYSKPITNIPYSSAKILAKYGFRMLFPGMVDLAENNNIKIIYRGVNNEGTTLISESKEFDYPVLIPIENGYLLAPINSKNSIEIISKFEYKIEGFNYNKSNNTLFLFTDNLDFNILHEFTISLY